MHPTVTAALIAGVAAIVTGCLTLYTTRAAERAKKRQEKNAEKLDVLRIQLENWDHLVDALQADIRRRDEELERRQHIIDMYRRKYGYLGDAEHRTAEVREAEGEDNG